MGREKAGAHAEEAIRDTYVKKLKNENKFKKWVQEQNENESGHKNTIYTAEKNKKQTIEKKHKVQREKVYACLLYTSPSPRDS